MKYQPPEQITILFEPCPNCDSILKFPRGNNLPAHTGIKRGGKCPECGFPLFIFIGKSRVLIFTEIIDG